jgi:hypothetical protein
MLLALFTLGLLVVGVLTYVTFDKQAKIMGRTLEQMKIDAKTRAFETEKQIKLTQDSIDLAREDFEASHRPWISVSDLSAVGSLIWDPQGNASITLSITIENVGRSPAIEVFVMAESHAGLVTRDILAAQDDFWRRTQPIPQDDVPWGHTMFPGAPPTSLRLNVQISADEIAETKKLTGSPGMAFSVIGYVEYKFAFGEAGRHLTEFAYLLNQMRGNFIGAINVEDGNVFPISLVLTPQIVGWRTT